MFPDTFNLYALLSGEEIIASNAPPLIHDLDAPSTCVLILPPTLVSKLPSTFSYLHPAALVRMSPSLLTENVDDDFNTVSYTHLTLPTKRIV